MKLTDLDYVYPENLIALNPTAQSRVMWTSAEQVPPKEITLDQLVDQFTAGDVLVINDTKVLKRRVFSEDNLEILFLSQKSDTDWEVLFPSRKLKVGAAVHLPKGVTLTLLEKGRPQLVRTSRQLSESYFQEVAELPLPPYIQQARHERHNVKEDETWYQTAWAEKPGSFAAPTASLHFREHHLQSLKNKGVIICKLTLHVGLGTFLPVIAEDLNDHKMHGEWCEVMAQTWQSLQSAKKQGKKVWALGTTVTRSLESAAHGLLQPDINGDFRGFSELLIQPGFEFRMVDVLLTNFHQPRSTLLALVAAFAGLDKVKQAYDWAMEKQFRLFSYGDLSVWQK